uniref:UPF0481 protein At3g02645 family n=1 Tax=Cajanus cajan TaxID=3821 RepID=A0A151RKM7_CAJCA|nr:Putative UPF0481 protein At3g02645 family [Cajanus cajan]
MASAESDSSSSVTINVDESEYKSHAVCVSRVPKSLSCGNPKAFTPHLVGFGPYHGSTTKLTITYELKLAAAKRALKYSRLHDHHHCNLSQCLDTRFSEFYHAVGEYHRSALVFDGLFLLGLIYSDVPAHPQEQTFFLTGKFGMPLVNDAGVELTMDAVIRDVFMLENQIPSRVLQQINHFITKDGIQIQDVGAKMLAFCQKHCPLVNLQELSRKPEEHHHLLDLMYHLAAPNKPPEPDNPNSDAEKPKEDGKAVLVGFPIYLIWKPLKWLLTKSGLSAAFDLVKILAHCLPMVGGFFIVLGEDQNFKPMAQNFQQFSATLEQTSMENNAHPAVTIPSVTELKAAGIHFEPAKGGISDIKYEERTCQFFLPVIKLDANSEFIMRNLVAYEALTKPTYFVFARYIEIMRAIIDIPEDVKVLVEKKIIVKELSDRAVADLFNGMSRSTRPTNTAHLEEEIKKVNAKFVKSQWLQRVMTKYVYPCWKLMTALAASAFLVLTAVKTYSSIYVCSSRRSSTLVNLPRDWDYYGITNDFVSSM